MSGLRVEVLRRLSSIAPLREQIDALNLLSRRPCPFATFEYLAAFLAHDEYFTREDEVLFLAAFEGDRLLAYLPLRKMRDRIAGIPFGRIGMLVSHDTDRPHAVARAEDEARCCAAFFKYLLEVERGWDVLDLAMQDEESGLSSPPRVKPLRYYLRRMPTMPNTTVPLRFASLEAYQRSLSSNARHANARYCRRLLAASEVEVVSCADPGGRKAMLDLYLDLERRSWKQAAHAGIARHPRRVAFFQALCDPVQPLALRFDFVVLDGVPACGVVSGSFNGASHALETAFDDAFSDLGPGHLMNLMLARGAIARGERGINYDGNYAYYKAELGGVVTPTSAIQIFRVGTAPWLKALLGDLKRRFFPPTAESGRGNPERRRVAQAQGEARPDRSAERKLAGEVLRDLEARGVRVERLAGEALRSALPFLKRSKEAA